MINGEPVVVLMVEDSEDHAELVVRNLHEHNVANRVGHVSDGQAALDYLLRRGDYSDPERSPRPHVVLLDLRLPKVDGLEVLRAVKEHPDLRAIPVVVLTTSQAERDVAGAYRHHVHSYLVKPVSPTTTRSSCSTARSTLTSTRPSTSCTTRPGWCSRTPPRSATTRAGSW